MAENQQDQDNLIEETIGKSEAFIQQNRKSLSIIIGALVLAVGGYLFYQKVYVAGKETETQTYFFRVEDYLKKDSIRLAINGDGNNPGLEEIVSDNSVSKSGNLAKLYLGFAYMKNKEYDKAIDALKSYSAEDVMTASLSLCLIGDAYMELKNTDEAIGYYEKASKEKANNFSTPVALMKLATALETKGSYNEAVEVYERIRKDYPTSNEGVQAEKYAARASAMAGK